MMGSDQHRRNGIRHGIPGTTALFAACLAAGLLTVGCAKDKSGRSGGSRSSGGSGAGGSLPLMVRGQSQPYHASHDLARRVIDAVRQNDPAGYRRCRVRPEDVAYVVRTLLPQAGVEPKAKPEKLIPIAEQKTREALDKAGESLQELRTEMEKAGVDLTQLEIASLKFEPEGAKYDRAGRAARGRDDAPAAVAPSINDAVLGQIEITVKSRGKYYRLTLGECVLVRRGWVSARGLRFRGPSTPPGFEGVQSDLHQITMAVISHTAAHSGRMPRTWGDLVPYLGDDLDALVLPASGKPVPTWDAETKKLTGESDYILVDYGPGTRMSQIEQVGQAVVAYIDPRALGADGTYAAFLDGHVEWIDRQELDKRLAEAKTIREKALQRAGPDR